MSDTYEAFYNGKPLNPNRGLPTMSYAQAEDCGLTDSERLWCRTDGDGTVITADEVPYDSNNSVKDKIDSMEIKFQQKSFNSFTIGANTYYDLDITITESGYTPVGIIQWTINGTGAVTVIYANIQNSTTARLRVRNNSNESVTSTGGNVTVLYTKS